MDEMKLKVEAVTQLVGALFSGLNVAIIIEGEDGRGRCGLGITGGEKPMAFIKIIKTTIEQVENTYLTQQN